MKRTRYTFLGARYWMLWLLATGPVALQAQAVDGFWDDIRERIANKEYLQVHGSTQLALRWNHISGISRRIQPFSGQMTAGLLVDILGVKGNFTAAFSDGNLTYNLPAYAFYGFSPSYKWIQLHLGDRSMELSPYTLSGQNFKGAGVELRPGKLHFAAFSGRLRTARQADAGAIQNIDPVFRRWGKGIKVGFEDGKSALGLAVFHAKDEAASLALSDTLTVRPQENVVIDIQGKKQIGDKFDVAFDLAHSALTRDLNAPENTITSRGLNGSILGLFKSNISSAYGNAWKFEIGFKPAIARFSLVAQRMDAGFQSLGRLAFLNDTENIQLGCNTSLFEKKLTLAVSAGLQRNGISEKSATKGVRGIGTVNASMNVSERTMLNVSLSNINYTMRQRLQTVPVLVVDSIVIVQNNTSVQLSGNFILGDKKQSVLLLTTAWQKASVVNESQTETAPGNDFYLGMAAYSWNEPEKGWTATLSCATNFTRILNTRNTIISPALQVGKKLLDDRLTLESGVSHSFVYSSLGNQTSIWETRLGGQFKVATKHQLRTSLSYVSNQTADEVSGLAPFRDFNGQLSYQFNF